MIVSIYLPLAKDSQTLIIIFAIIYILYFCFEYGLTVGNFLRNKTNEMGIKNIIQGLIHTPPTIEFYCHCYHYSGSRRHSPPKRGEKKSSRRFHSSKNSKITTYTETAYLPYYSDRDVTGLFQLNSEGKDMTEKVYIKLELTPEINFADKISYWVYENFRANFYARNRPRDRYMDYCEN